jgi:hypothetical protein
MGVMKNAYKILLGKREGKRPFRRTWHRWEDNIKIDLRKIRLEGVNWIHLAQDMDQLWVLVNTVTNLHVP